MEALRLRKVFDTSGSWDYVEPYADKAKIEPAKACLEVLANVLGGCPFAGGSGKA